MTACGFSSGRLAEAIVLAVLLAMPLRAAESTGTNRLSTALESTRPSDASSILEKVPGRPDSLDSLFRRDNGPLLTPPRPTVTPRNRTTSVLDDPESWVLMTPAQAIEDFIAREVLELPQLGPDGRDRSSMSSLERLHDRVARNSQPESAGSLDWLGIRFDTPAAPSQPGPGESFRFENIPSRLEPPSLESLATRRPSDVNLRDNPIAESIMKSEQERFTEAFRRALNPQPYALTTPGFPQPQPLSSGASLNPNPLPTPGIAERPSRTAMPQLPGVPRQQINGLPSLPTVPGVFGQQNANEDIEANSRPTRIEPPRIDPGVPQRGF